MTAVAGMFDRVIIRVTPETSASGHAGLQGAVYGVTTPSVTGVDVIGEHDDVAVNVNFGDAAPTAWFAPDLVERLGHDPGQTLKIGGAVLVRKPDGTWADSARRPWWRFW